MSEDLKRLYNEKGKEASIYDVIEWFNCYYPEDIFIDHDIAKARNILNRMLEKVKNGALKDNIVKQVTRVAVFGPSKVNIQEHENLFNYLDTVQRPFIIVTSTCQGWDKLGRDYADYHRGEGVRKKIFKAHIKELGYKKGVETCNEEISSVVNFGVTCSNPSTPGTKHMIETLEKKGKKIVYIGKKNT